MENEFKRMRQIVDKVSSLSREDIQEILEAHGFAVFDTESLMDLKVALAVNIDDNTISESCLDKQA